MDIGILIATWLAISGVVTAATTYAKSVLVQVPFFQQPENQALLSVLLQTIAFFVGALTAYGSGVNVLASFPPFAAAPAWFGYVLMGFASLLGGQGGYILLSILAGHTIPAPPPSAQVAPPPETEPATYVPFVVVPRSKPTLKMADKAA